MVEATIVTCAFVFLFFFTVFLSCFSSCYFCSAPVSIRADSDASGVILSWRLWHCRHPHCCCRRCDRHRRRRHRRCRIMVTVVVAIAISSVPLPLPCPVP